MLLVADKREVGTAAGSLDEGVRVAEGDDGGYFGEIEGGWFWGWGELVGEGEGEGEMRM